MPVHATLSPSFSLSLSLSLSLSPSPVSKREKERGRKKERERGRERENFFKGMTGALAPFSFLVIYILHNKLVRLTLATILS
jgi:hypothetical protein